MSPSTKLAIFASGGGSNAQKIMEHFKSSQQVEVVLVVCNKQGAGVINIAQSYGIPVQIIDRHLFYESEALLDVLKSYQVDFLVLAGFLWLVPTYLVRAFPRKIVNIHPALLPKFGGKGMYGMHVHAAVKAAAETSSGMTIHYVNEHYDEGDIIFQASCPLDPADSPETIAQKVLSLEHQFYPKIIEQILIS